MEKINYGECWLLTDGVNKSDHVTIDDSDHTIQYNRPCIVLRGGSTTAMVIPLTSKNNPRYVKYPLQIDENRASYALLCQIRTVDVSKLTNFIGVIDPNVMDDIRRNVVRMLNCSPDKNFVPVREKIKPFNRLDIRKFYSYHVYFNPSTKKAFMTIRTDRENAIAIPVYLGYRKMFNDKETKLFCGRVIHQKDMDKPSIIDRGHEFYDIFKVPLIDIGFEPVFAARERLAVKYSEYLSYDTVDVEDSMESITSAIRAIYGVNAYLRGFREVRNLVRRNDRQKTLFKCPNRIFNISKERRKHMEKHIKIIQSYVLTHADPLTCSSYCLNRMMLKPQGLVMSLSLIIDIFNIEGNRNKAFDGNRLRCRYKKGNIVKIIEHLRQFKDPIVDAPYGRSLL